MGQVKLRIERTEKQKGLREAFPDLMTDPGQVSRLRYSPVTLHDIWRKSLHAIWRSRAPVNAILLQGEP
jgi:hypothetical protein